MQYFFWINILKKLSIVSLLTFSAAAFAMGWDELDWVQSYLINSSQKKIGDINGIPILSCSYKVGYTGNVVIDIKVHEYSCPQVIEYNVEKDKWRK